MRTWNVGKDLNNLDGITRELKPWSVEALVIQFNYGFFNHFELNDFIQSLIAQGIVIIVDLHSTVDPYGDVENFRLADFLGALRKCHLILAHSSLDLDRLKALGLIKNVTLFPHGVVNKGHGLTPPRKQGIPPVIASFGFCLPNKGLLELVEAVSLLKKESTPVRLLMVNAEHPAAESAAEVQKIKRAIEQLGLRDEVEMHTEFLDDNECLALLGKADLVVNPYQRTGESASGSARYGLTAGRPVAVTPLAIFDDLDDAVFHLPGIAPHEIAVGVASVLKHLKEGTETATRVKVAARQWIEEHDYSRQAIGLMRTARSLARSKKVARGAFINTAKENCSIHESGRMVFNCIRESDQYALDYFPLDTFDVSILAREGRIELLDKSKSSGAKPFDEYDFWVFNWHFITMAPLLALESIAQLAGAKFSIILELEPGDPLKLIPSDIFDGYIALDPTTPEAGKIFPFPRPLEGDPRIPHSSRAVPVIGSFGFGTPGKGFELLVEAVNREFDKAVVRINIPKGAYTSSMDSIHRQEYSKYIAMQCMRIAKPGIEVRVTSIFMSPHELVDWCADNDLNCFLYTRRQSGLSATTDQAIMSGRPLLTGSNDTFRHIHRYIPAYPIVSLREAIKTTAPMVRRMQKEWSQASFSETFERMLAKFGLISRYGNVGRELPTSGDQRKIIVVASRRSTSDDDILSYSTRLADCLGRSGNYEVIRMCCSDPSDLIAQTTKLRPSAVILADSFSVPRSVLTKALVHVPGANIILSDDPKFASADNVRSAGEPFVLARYPIIPYYTPYIASQEEPPRIMLIGFGCQASNLDEVMAKISQEVPGADVFLETPESNLSEFEIRASQVPKRLGHPIRLKHVLVSLPAKGDEIIRSFVENRLTVFFNDLNRTEELENLCSLALTTERPVAFTRAAPFRHFLNDGTFIEDQSISDIINLGIGAQIRLCHEFGEGNFYAQIDRLLTDELA